MNELSDLLLVQKRQLCLFLGHLHAPRLQCGIQFVQSRRVEVLLDVYKRQQGDDVLSVSHQSLVLIAEHLACALFVLTNGGQVVACLLYTSRCV